MPPDQWGRCLRMRSRGWAEWPMLWWMSCRLKASKLTGSAGPSRSTSGVPSERLGPTSSAGYASCRLSAGGADVVQLCGSDGLQDAVVHRLLIAVDQPGNLSGAE